MKRHWSRRFLVYALLLVVLEEGAGSVLRNLDLVDRLLASDVPLHLGILPLAAVFFTLRFLVLFLVPGLCLAALFLGWIWRPQA